MSEQPGVPSAPDPAPSYWRTPTDRPVFGVHQQASPPAFWASQGAADPWRDPVTRPIWVPPGSPASPGAPVADPYAPPGAPPAGRPASLGLAVLVSAVIALFVGALAGLGAYGIAQHRFAGTAIAPDKPLDTPLGAPPTSRAPQSVAGIAAQVLPSVVSLDVSGSNQNDTGSGFVIRPDGYILTNNHVVAAAANGGTVRAVFNDGSSTSATIVGRDPISDLAVVRVSRNTLPAVPLGDSAGVAVGDPVVAIGSPLGLAGTVTSGIVSALDRPVKAEEGGGDASDASQSFLSAIQTDAAINPGNSGGPLVDGAGRVIGVNSAIASLASPSGVQPGSIGLGFAIPINHVKRIAAELISTGHATHSVIGASIEQISGGVRLIAVPAGPAQRAGLHTGDVVVRFEGKVVTDTDDFIAAVRSHDPGARVSVTVRRGSQQRTVALVLGAARN